MKQKTHTTTVSHRVVRKMFVSFFHNLVVFLVAIIGQQLGVALHRETNKR